MPVTHEQVALIRWSFDKLAQRMEPASVWFYEELFRRSPELRKFFRDDLAGQGMKFMSTLGVMIDGLESPAAMAGEVAELGQLHGRLGIEPDMFSPMEEALIATLRHELGGDLAPDVEAAWRAAYAELSQAMIAAGKG